MSGPEADVGAVVLAGGRGTRLGGVDKAALVVAGRPLLVRVVAAARAAGADDVVVVGDERPLRGSPPVRWVREDPPHAGPLHALAAGAALVRGGRVLVLATDLPLLDGAVLRLLLDALGPAAPQPAPPAAVLVDPDGRDQPLLAAWRADALRAALDGLAPTEGGRLRALLDAVPGAVRVPAPAGGRAVWRDCDTPVDLTAAEEEAGRA